MRVLLILLCLASPALAKSYSSLKPQCVCVVRFPIVDNRFSVGSGAVIGPTLVLTCVHVVRDTTAQIRFADGTTDTATLVGHDFKHDLSLLRLGRERTEWMEVRTDPVKDGESFRACGFGGNRYGYTRCVWSRGQFRMRGGSVVNGDSGGPIVDSDFRVVGVICESENGGILWGYNPRHVLAFVRANDERVGR